MRQRTRTSKSVIALVSLSLLLVSLLLLASPAQAVQVDYTDRELAEKFAPNVVLHSEESFEPINAEWFIRHSRLLKETSGFDEFIKESISPSELDDYDDSRYYLNLRNEYWQYFPQYNGDADKTVYYRVTSTSQGKVLQYWFFYPYSEYAGFDLGLSTHESDWEMVQFTLNEENHYFPLRTGYAQHYIGRKSHWTMQDKLETHPTVYPARRGHATYYRAGYQPKHSPIDGYIDLDASWEWTTSGKHARSGGENTGGGKILQPSDYNLVNLEKQSWVDWNGRWDSKKHSGPRGKTDYFGNNVWSNPLGFFDQIEPYTTGAMLADYSPPSANLPRPQEVNPEEEVVFRGEAADDEGYLEHHWSVADDVVKNGGAEISRTFNKGGDYQIELTVVDNEGASVTRSITYHVNQYPKAVLELITDTVKTFEKVDLRDRSEDPDGDIVQRTWSYAAESVTTTLPSISFEDDGEYDIKLTVEDDDGLTDTVTKTVTVLNRPPKAGISYTPRTVYHDTPVKFSSTSSDRDGSITTYQWSIDGQQISTENFLTHTFSDAVGGVSQYSVELTVEDDDGDTDTDTATISIANRKPEAVPEANRTEVYTDAPITFTSSSKDPDGSIASTTWAFGDGEKERGESVTHAYSEPGTYEVTLAVEDGAGGIGKETIEIHVEAKSFTEGVTHSIKTKLEKMMNWLRSIFG